MEPLPSSASGTESRPLQLISPDQATGRDRWMWLGVLLLLVLVAYVPAVLGGFIWDDARHVTDNPSLRSPAGLINIWIKSLNPTAPENLGRVTPQYYPVTHTTFWIEYQLWQDWPAGYHLVNVLLHACAAAMLWQVLRMLKLPGAFVIAALWAVHPANVESVAWISERKNVLSTLGMFASAFFYLRWAGIDPQRPRQSYDWWAALGLFLLAMLSKTVACMLPPVLLVVLWWKRRGVSWRDVLPLAPMFIIGIALGLFTVWLERHNVRAQGPDWDFAPLQRLLIAGNALWFYVGKLVWPANLTFSYPRWNVDPSQAIWYVGPVAAVLGALLLWVLRKRIGYGAFAAVACFALLLFPALGFFNIYPMRYTLVADHYQYAASVALLSLAVVTIARIVRRMGKAAIPVAFTAAGLVLLVLGGASWLQARIYTSDATLWADTLRKNPSSWMANFNLGAHLFFEARSVQEQGVQLLQQAQALEESGLPATTTRTEATLLIQQASQLREQAIQHFARTLELRPSHDRAHTFWAGTLVDMGRPQEAISHYRRAIELNPQSVEAHLDLGQTFLKLDRRDAAMEQFDKARQLEPDSARVRFTIASIYASAGMPAEAEASYREALRVNEKHVEARYDLALLLARQGRQAEAIEHLQRVLADRPDDADGWAMLGFLYAETAQPRQAVSAFQQSLRIDPNNPKALHGAALIRQAVNASATQRAATQQSAPATAPAE